MSLIVHKSYFIKPDKGAVVAEWAKKNLRDVVKNSPEGWQLLDVTQRVGDVGELLFRWKVKGFSSLDYLTNDDSPSTDLKSLFQDANDAIDNTKQGEFSLYFIHDF